MSSTIYFGGSFNPIHNGHINMAKHVAEKLMFDKVILIPAREPYHKKVEMVDYEKRLTMTRIAVSNDPLFDVSDVEHGMTGNSYAIDVLERLGAFRDGSTANYLIGADTALQIQNWHRYDDLKKLVRFIVVLRQGVTLNNALPFQHELIEFNLNISSTDIRNRCKRGESIDGLVPDHLSSFMKSRCLYR